MLRVLVRTVVTPSGFRVDEFCCYFCPEPDSSPHSIYFHCLSIFSVVTPSTVDTTSLSAIWGRYLHFHVLYLRQLIHTSPPTLLSRSQVQ